jgi:hypothetical protein
MSEAIRRDKDEFPSQLAAQLVADQLNADLPEHEPEPFVVVPGSKYGDIYFVVAPDGSHVVNPEPAPKTNPFGNRRQDRPIEPAGSTHRSGTRSNPL